MTNFSAFVGLVLIIQPTFAQTVQGPATPESLDEIRYMSSDLGHVMVFSKGGARSGDILAIYAGSWPSYPVTNVKAGGQVQCISVGPPGNTVEYALKRPIKAGDKYECLKTSFLVKRCFQYCHAAVVEVKASARSGSLRGVTRKTYMYVDRCLGLLAYSQTKDLTKGIPLDAVWLRGTVGILADENYPECNENPDYSDGRPD